MFRILSSVDNEPWLGAALCAMAQLSCSGTDPQTAVASATQQLAKVVLLTDHSIDVAVLSYSASSSMRAFQAQTPARRGDAHRAFSRTPEGPGPRSMCSRGDCSHDRTRARAQICFAFVALPFEWDIPTLPSLGASFAYSPSPAGLLHC